MRYGFVWLVIALVLVAMVPVGVTAEPAGLKRTAYNAEGRMRSDLLILRYEEGNAKLKELTRKLLLVGNTKELVREAIQLVLNGGAERAKGCIPIRYQFHQAAMPAEAEVVAYQYDDVSLPEKPKSHTVLEQDGEGYQLENCHGLSAIEYPRSASTPPDTRAVLDIQADMVYPITGRIVSASGQMAKSAGGGRNILDVAIVRQP